MITVSGRTFDHRETLKNMGGRWNATTSQWELDRASPIQLANLRSMVGCIVREENPAPIRNDFINQLVQNIINRRSNDRNIGRYSTTIYGDNPQYFNTFKDINPRAFFGFSSLGALVRYVKDIPQEMRENDGWKTRGDLDWIGTSSMTAALMLAQDGWSDGLRNAEEIADIISIEHMQTKRRKHSAVGGSVNVGRLLSGNPAHMRQRPRRAGRRVVTLYVETFMSAAIKPANAVARAAVVAAMCDVMEMRGYSCELVALATSGGPDYQIAVTLKAAGEKLSLPDTVFALGHPSFFRRMLFAVIGSSEECRSVWGHMGFPANAFDEKYPTKPSEHYINKLDMGDQGRIDTSSLRSRALSILPFVVPENLEIELNDHRND